MKQISARHWIKLALGLLLASGAPALIRGQAYYYFNNSYLVNAPVFDSAGVPLTGTNYLAELYGGVAAQPLTPAKDERDFNRRLIEPFATDGYFGSGPAVVFPGTQGGSYLWLQLRAWDAGLGPTYEEAVSRGLGGYGESPLFYAQGASYGHLSLPNPLFGLQSFKLRPITPAVLMRSIHRDGNQITLEWNPGFARYQLQQTASLDQPWQNVGDPTTLTTAMLPITGPAQFFRVIGFLQ